MSVVRLTAPMALRGKPLRGLRHAATKAAHGLSYARLPRPF